AKRLFGFIISGGSLGGIFGGLVANRFAERIGTENLLILGALLLGFCIVLINVIWKYERTPHRSEEEAIKGSARGPAEQLQEKSSWKLFLRSRYLLLIAALVMIAKISSTIIDNQFNAVVEGSILEKNARTAFFGGFMALLNGVSFFMQLVLASYALRRLGIGISLLLLPIGLCFGSIATLFWSALGVAAFAKIYDGSFNYSINQLSKEILYLPIPSRTRYRVKPLIDMLAYRASKTVAGLLIILLTPLLGISDEKLGVIVLLLIPLWVIAAWEVRDEYIQSIKTLLTSQKTPDKTLSTVLEAREVLANLEGEKSFDELKRFLAHRSSVTRKMSAAACLAFYSGAHDVERVRRLAEEMIRYEALEFKGIDVDRLFKQEPPARDRFFDRELIDLLQAKQSPHLGLKALLEQHEHEILSRFSDSLSDVGTDGVTKRKAIMLLVSLGTQGAVDILLHGLAAVCDCSLRFNMIRALNRIRARGDRYHYYPRRVKKEVLNEVRSYKSMRTVLETYQKRRKVSRPEDDYLFATLKAMEEENLERIFRLLGLIYETETIHVIYDRLVDPDSNQHVKANALELLQNALEPELSWALCPVLDENYWERIKKKDLDTIVIEFLESQDRWLVICAIFLIVELHLDQFYSKLDEILRSKLPIVHEAAEIALMKIGHKNDFDE
ncbi:MAG: MFS transporter, partial [Candidatus Omnitrophica bacterium]|nr:MFS transporter [Candidatus Omnitrophota bacterium]